MQYEMLCRRQPAYKTVADRLKMHLLFGLKFGETFKRLDTGVLKCKAPIPYQAGEFDGRGVIFFFRKREITTRTSFTSFDEANHRVARLAFVETPHAAILALLLHCSAVRAPLSKRLCCISKPAAHHSPGSRTHCRSRIMRI